MIPPRKYQANKHALPGATRRRRIRQAWDNFARSVGAFAEHQFPLWLAAERSRRSLEHVAGPDRPVGRNGVVLVAPYFGEARLVGPFLRHHRELGIKECVFLDLSSERDLGRRLNGDNATIWRPRGIWQPSEALHFLNGLRNRYAYNRWCLSLNVTDFFVFFRSETRSIGDLTDFLESESRRQLLALVIDMYGESSASTLAAEAADEPLRALSYFDPFGYVIPNKHSDMRDTIVRGGVQRRAVYASDPRKLPAINRMPLIKWERYCAYIAENRLAAPYRLNAAHAPWHTSPTACLLRFGLLIEPDALILASEIEQAALVKDEGEASYMRLARMRDMNLRRDFSRAFTSTGDLVEAGLLNPGQWF